MYIKIIGSELKKFTNKKIILFGASSTGVKALEEFQSVNADIVGFCDNSEKKRGTFLQGYPIYMPQDLKKLILDDSDICVMITSTYEAEIQAQLKEMGIGNVYLVRMGVLHDQIKWSEFLNPMMEEKEANSYIASKIKSEEPFFMGRVGSTELETICNYMYFTDRIHGSNTPYTNNITNMLCDWCGFFPADHVLMDKFCQLYLEKIKDADMLWCMWKSRYENKLFQDVCPNTILSKYDDTGFPVNMEIPWTTALKGKKVLVIHPFEDSIKENYKIKDKLFSNHFLPDFELITLKAVQTLADNKSVPFETWFNALDYMKRQMEKIDFDIALIGAGAYGFPLGAYAKELGKKALHIGGMLQLYFGIRGKYYDQFEYHNEYWTRPLEEEKPKGFNKVEAGRYW